MVAEVFKWRQGSREDRKSEKSGTPKTSFRLPDFSDLLASGLTLIFVSSQ
jgi:hypothetical protein